MVINTESRLLIERGSGINRVNAAGIDAIKTTDAGCGLSPYHYVKDQLLWLGSLDDKQEYSFLHTVGDTKRW